MPKNNELPYGANGIGCDDSLLILRPDKKGCDVLKQSFDKEFFEIADSITYNLTIVKEGAINEIKLNPITASINQIYTLPNGQILLVDTYGSKDSFPGEIENGFFFNSSGELKKCLKLGPNIDNLVIDSFGNLWINYLKFNVKTLGNLGGVRKMNVDGIETNQNNDDFLSISRILINEDNDRNLWLLRYYSHGRELIRLSKDKRAVFNPLMTLEHCTGMINGNDKIGFIYTSKDKTGYVSLIISPIDSYNGMARYILLDEKGDQLYIDDFICNKDNIYFFANDSLYNIKLGTDF